MASMRVIFIVMVLLTVSHVGRCLECYTCTAINDNCKDKFNSKGIIVLPCTSPQQDSCVKLELDGDVVGRNCGNKAACSKMDSCHSCDTDKCNSSSSIVPSFIATSIVALIITKHFM